MAIGIPVSIFKTQLLKLLDETFSETKGIYLDRKGALFETVRRLSANQASRSVSPKGTTIAGHVEHVRFYLRVLTDSIEGKAPRELDWSESWKVTAVDEAEWAAVSERLREAYRHARDVIESLETWEGDDDIDASLAILAHTAVHLGAIHQAMHAIA